MWQPKIAAPTFLFRDRAEKELPEILKRYAEIGFDGVEFTGFFGWGKEDIQRMLREYSLQPAGKKAMSAQDLLNSRREWFVPGNRLV